MKKLHDKKGVALPFIKFDLKMKLTTLFVFATFFSMLASNGYSQAITLEEENITIAKVIDKIEATTKYRFVYNTKFVDLQRKVSIKLKKASIEKVLINLFDNTNTAYKLRGTQVVLKEKIVAKKSDYKDLNKQSSNDEKQQSEISGTVTDDTGQPLPGATIIVKGTSTGATTDFDGKYTLAIENEDAIIVVSYIGFTAKEIPVNGQTEIMFNW